MKSRIKKLLSKLSENLYERDEIVALALLSSIAGKPVFLYGPPGTAKSFIARRITSAFKDSKYFGYLMQRFSTPEDIFGPVSLEALKNDKYVRKTKGYLPEADFAFLDEIWKSSPAILNTLLTIINERIFKNGYEEITVPLKALISASNETPPPNQGLDALYDRFIMRIIVNPLKQRDNFEKLLSENIQEAYINIEDELKFSTEEWIYIEKEINNVVISKEVMDIIHTIKVAIEDFNESKENLDIYISDRRWQNIAYILKTVAYLCGRNEVIAIDAMILSNCLWTLEDNIKYVEDIVETAVGNSVKLDIYGLKEYLEDYKNFLEDIDNTFFYLDKVYDSEEIDGQKYTANEINVIIDESQSKADILIYIPLKYLNKDSYFYPLDQGRNITKKIRCKFIGTEECIVEINSYTNIHGLNSNKLSRKYQYLTKIMPKYSIKKTKLKPVKKEVKAEYINISESYITKIDTIIKDTEKSIEEKTYDMENPFISESKIEFVKNIYRKRIDELKNYKLDLERLKENIKSYEVI